MKKFQLNQQVKIVSPGWNKQIGKIIEIDPMDEDGYAPYLVEYGHGFNKQRVYFAEEELVNINSDRIKKKLGIK